MCMLMYKVDSKDKVRFKRVSLSPTDTHAYIHVHTHACTYTISCGHSLMYCVYI